MKTKLTFLIIAAALAAATAGRAQTVISYSTDGGAQALETGSVRQTVLDTATLEVSYRMEWLRRPDSKEPMQDLLLLQAGGKVTKFFSYKTLQRTRCCASPRPSRCWPTWATSRGAWRPSYSRTTPQAR